MTLLGIENKLESLGKQGVEHFKKATKVGPLPR